MDNTYAEIEIKLFVSFGNRKKQYTYRWRNSHIRQTTFFYSSKSVRTKHTLTYIKVEGAAIQEIDILK